jgi:heparin binding hemagglutinin HbhA
MTQPDDQKNQPQNDLASELRELGQQLEEAVRTAITSDRAKQIQADISSGMKEIGVQLQSAVKSIQDNPQVQQLVQRGEQAVSQAQQTKVAHDFQQTLARGIALLNDQLSDFANRMRQATDSTTPPAGDASTTPPAGEAPATGETTRLDPDNQ